MQMAEIGHFAVSHVRSTARPNLYGIYRLHHKAAVCMFNELSNLQTSLNPEICPRAVRFSCM